MEKTVFGVGIIGCGTFCSAYLSTLGSVFTNCKVVACSDIDLDRAFAVAKEWNIPHPCTTEELLADPAVDMAVIVTGPNSHYPLILQCLRAGKHVYCEKPMAITLEQTNEIVALAEEKGLHVTVAPDTILDARVQTIRKALDDGMIGKPLNVTLNFVGPGADFWHPQPDFLYKRGGGPIMDMGPYYLTVAVSLLGPIEQVFCYSSRGFDTRRIYDHDCAVEVDTDFTAILKFRSGVIGNFNVSFDGVRTHAPGMEIYGTEGLLLCPDPNTLAGELLCLKRDKLREAVTAFSDKPFERVNYLYSDESFQLAEPVPTAFPLLDAHRGMGPSDMADCVLNGTQPRCSMYLARHITEVLLAFDECVKTGQPYNMTTTCQRPDPIG